MAPTPVWHVTLPLLRRASLPSCGVQGDGRWRRWWVVFFREKRGFDRKTYGVRNTQLQDPSTVNTCVMLNRIDKWEGRWNNAV